MRTQTENVMPDQQLAADGSLQVSSLVSGVTQRGVDRSLIAPILLDGLPNSPVGAPVRRATADEVFANLKGPQIFGKEGRARVQQQLDTLVESGVLVTKRADGNTVRYSITAHPEKIADPAMRQVVEAAVAERLSRAPLPVKESKPVAATGTSPSITSQDPADRARKSQARLEAALRNEVDVATKHLTASLSGLMEKSQAILTAFFVTDCIVNRPNLVFETDAVHLPFPQRELLRAWTTELRKFGSTFPDPETIFAIVEDLPGNTRRLHISASAFKNWDAKHLEPNRSAAFLAARVSSSIAGKLQGVLTRCQEHGMLDPTIAADVTQSLKKLEIALRIYPNQEISEIRRNLVALLDPPQKLIGDSLLAVESLRRSFALPAVADAKLQSIEEGRAKEIARKSSVLRSAEELLAAHEVWCRAETAFKEECRVILVAVGGAPTEEARALSLRQTMHDEIRAAVLKKFASVPYLSQPLKALAPMAAGSPAPESVRQFVYTEKERWLSEKLKAGFEPLTAHAGTSIHLLAKLIMEMDAAPHVSEQHAEAHEGCRQVLTEYATGKSSPRAKSQTSAPSAQEIGARMRSAVGKVQEVYAGELAAMLPRAE
ncbi:MAG: hypothetical protein J0M12_03895 [Deltaproteobacteria bacterium]|nr:hypothetical protein [Deltaproteobacteria bacterium]